MNSYNSCVLWFTGLSGAGKSTLAHTIEEELYQLGFRTFVLDADNVRQDICSDLDFSVIDRRQNIRCIAETVKLMVEAGLIVITAFISLFRDERDRACNLLAEEDFVEIYCAAPLEVCESSDVRGLYVRVRAGEVKEFTGISSPYEPPLNPELIVDTQMPLQHCVEQVIKILCGRGLQN